MSTVLSNEGFGEALGYPSIASKGIIISVYYVGTFISYLIVSHPISDWLGRRYAALSGTLVVCLGAILQGVSNGATAFGTMVAGRVISGLGVAIVSTSVPLYQALVLSNEPRYIDN
ncbi:ascus development protein [Colletotrichum tofieldiae]|nr:ascus development protein [Colletotrichum tofieldiae]